jgi:putative DNA primase/helicase
MWDHLASTLTGECPDQTFNMYIGVGRNGKSALIELMSLVLGTYKGDVPVSLITEKRTKVGGVSPEIVSLKGIRYAVMQEPSKDARVNEGMMKQLTGGDTLQGRAPYMPDMVTFIPQFKLVICANYDLNFDSFDDGTWRRIRRVDFESVFVENPVEGDAEKPYQFKIDKDMKKKFETWKEVFLSMLVQRIFDCKDAQFNVKDCNKVMRSSEKYKLRQDFIAEFIEEKVVKVDDPTMNTSPIRKTDISYHFTEWYTSLYGHKLKPNITDVYNEFEKKFGKLGANKAWNNIRFIRNNESTDEKGKTEDEELQEKLNGEEEEEEEEE